MKKSKIITGEGTTKRKLIFHIGAQKVMSTTMQTSSVMRDNFNVINFIVDPDIRELVLVLIADHIDYKRVKNYFLDLICIRYNNPDRHLYFSDEIFSVYTSETVYKRVFDFLQSLCQRLDLQIETVFFIREQSAAILSHFTFFKNGALRPKEFHKYGWPTVLLGNRMHSDYFQPNVSDLNDLIDSIPANRRWLDILGIFNIIFYDRTVKILLNHVDKRRIHIFVYESLKQDRDGFISKFSTVFDLEPVLASSVFDIQRNSQTNKHGNYVYPDGISNKQYQHFFSIFPVWVRRFGANSPFMRMAGRLLLFYKKLNPRPIKYSDRNLVIIKECYQESNDWLNKEFNLNLECYGYAVGKHPNTAIKEGAR